MPQHNAGADVELGTDAPRDLSDRDGDKGAGKATSSVQRPGMNGLTRAALCIVLSACQAPTLTMLVKKQASQAYQELEGLGHECGVDELTAIVDPDFPASPGIRYFTIAGCHRRDVFQCSFHTPPDIVIGLLAPRSSRFYGQWRCDVIDEPRSCGAQPAV